MSIKRFFRRSAEDSELSEELESHLAHEIDDNLARGMSPDEARRLAYVKLGNPLLIRDRVWETKNLRPLRIPGAICAMRRALWRKLRASLLWRCW